VDIAGTIRVHRGGNLFVISCLTGEKGGGWKNKALPTRLNALPGRATRLSGGGVNVNCPESYETPSAGDGLEGKKGRIKLLGGGRGDQRISSAQFQKPGSGTGKGESKVDRANPFLVKGRKI